MAALSLQENACDLRGKALRLIRQREGLTSKRFCTEVGNTVTLPF